MPNIFPLISDPQTAQVEPGTPTPQSAILGTVAAPSRAKLAFDAANQGIDAAKAKLAADTPQKYDYSAHSVLGNIGHVIGRFGNIAGDIVDPNATARIPGSDLNNEKKMEQDREGIRSATADATAAGRESDVVGNEQANRDAEQGRFNAGSDQRDATLDATKANTDKTREETAPLTASQAAMMNALYGSKGFAPGMSPQESKRLEDAHRTLAEMQSKKDEFAQREQQHAQDHADAEGDKAAQRSLTRELAGNRQDTAGRNAAYKAYQPAMDSSERVNVMTQNYEDAIKNHDQQAMLSLLANHLGMTMGLQKGARISKDIVQEAQKSQPYLQGLQAHFDKDGYLSGVALSPNQMRSMVGLAHDRFREDISKSRNEAQYLGAQDDGPARTPSLSTMHYYLSQAGGDVQKAKQLAAEGGWSVK